MDGCERLTGDRPLGCPWRSLSNPLVMDAITLVSMASTGMGVHIASLAALDPSARALAAAQHFATIRNRVRSADDEAQRQMDAKRQKQQRFGR